MSSTPSSAADSAAELAAWRPAEEAELRPGRGEPDLGRLGPGPTEHGHVGDTRGPGRRQRCHHNGRALVHVEEGAHPLGIGLGHQPVVGADRGQLGRCSLVSEPRRRLGRRHRRERGHEIAQHGPLRRAVRGPHDAPWRSRRGRRRARGRRGRRTSRRRRCRRGRHLPQGRARVSHLRHRRRRPRSPCGVWLRPPGPWPSVEPRLRPRARPRAPPPRWRPQRD